MSTVDGQNPTPRKYGRYHRNVHPRKWTNVPWKRNHFERKGLSSNHQVWGHMLVFRGIHKFSGEYTIHQSSVTVNLQKCASYTCPNGILFKSSSPGKKRFNTSHSDMNLGYFPRWKCQPIHGSLQVGYILFEKKVDWLKVWPVFFILLQVL